MAAQAWAYGQEAPSGQKNIRFFPGQPGVVDLPKPSFIPVEMYPAGLKGMEGIFEGIIQIPAPRFLNDRPRGGRVVVDG
jgi:hypothetical protein